MVGIRVGRERNIESSGSMDLLVQEKPPSLIPSHKLVESATFSERAFSALATTRNAVIQNSFSLLLLINSDDFVLLLKPK